MATPTFAIYLATVTGAYPATWVDITEYVLKYSVNYGRDDILDQIQPGSGVVTVRNYTGVFSRRNTSSPLYPHVDSMRAIKIEIVYLGVTYPRALGYIQSVRPNPADPLNTTDIQFA